MTLTSDEPFQEARIRLRRLYAQRSAYVHRGKDIAADGGQVASISRRVLECLLRSRESSAAQHSDFVHMKWLPQLDYLAEALKAAIEISETHLRTCGIKNDFDHASRSQH